MDKNEIISILEDQGISLNLTQIGQLDQYLTTLVETNKSLNLTAITESNEVWLKHFYDSLTPLIYMEQLQGQKTLVDVGTGAGFPGVVLKIVQPKLEVTLVDSLQKRLNFLNGLTNELGLTGIQTVHARAEDFGQDKTYRESFDFVTARAVANSSTLLEYLLPLTKIGGQVILYKSASYKEELAESTRALRTLGGEIGDVHEFELPNGDLRAVIEVNKISKTPNKYPRLAGTPTKKPLK
ncbi:MAG: 16S rRNA (guanine(527)-N(7))-methyltransferase RsmG [Lactobacillaceae bacterium]|jgi:16S rRNA (guanine527-N7)-methyltransferase|nr:16S rRNA (guanine(527)-N(7))-methyltransferase RsmG [Lactobacillaceae bacterium]